MTEIIEAVGSVTSANGKWRARLIESNVQGSSAYYSSEVLEAGAHLFKKGTHMYMNHATAEEMSLRPEGDVNNLIGVLASDAVMESDGLHADLTIFEHHKKRLKEMAPYIGLSIRAHGSVEESDSGPVLKEFIAVESVDVVTKPGAGGKFVSLEESAKPGVLEDIVTPKSKELKMDQEIREAFDKMSADISALATTLPTAIAEAIKPAAEPNVEEASEVPTAEVAEALIAADLPKSARGRILGTTFETADALAEAIKAETDAVNEILESRKGDAGEFKMVESKTAEPNKYGSIFA